MTQDRERCRLEKTGSQKVERPMAAGDAATAGPATVLETRLVRKPAHTPTALSHPLTVHTVGVALADSVQLTRPSSARGQTLLDSGPDWPRAAAACSSCSALVSEEAAMI